MKWFNVGFDVRDAPNLGMSFVDVLAKTEEDAEGHVRKAYGEDIYIGTVREKRPSRGLSKVQQ